MKVLSNLKVLVCSVGLISAGLVWAQSTPAQSSPAVISQLIRGTQSGAVQGVLEGDIIAFRGIPYAAPPVGNLRWRPPQPPISWSGIRDASSFGNACPQMKDNGQVFGNEDCLVLNIFVSQNLQGPRQPVMVFFHGGGNQRGSTSSRVYNTPPLATHGVVVVTAEYRLGLLGFFANSLLTIEGGGSSGNYGLMDQIAALTWVQENIAAFGGDPTKVMVFGQSAGADDVQALLVSPPAQGKFSAVGIESGRILSGSLNTLSQLEVFDEPIVSLLGCGSAADVLSCLRAVPADVIVNNESAVLSFAIIEPRVIPVDPFVALQQNGSPVPLLIGSTREEATGLFDDPFAGLDTSGYAAAVHAEWDPIGPGVADQVLSFYPVTAYDSPTYALIAEDSDSVETCPIRDVARAAAGANRPPVWRYLFTHRIENNPFLNAFGAYHREELFFVFGNLGLDSGAYVPTPAEVNLSEQLMGYWSRFAGTGNPNGAGATRWPRYDATTDTMLQLDDTLAVIYGYHNPQCDYFSTLRYLFL